MYAKNLPIPPKFDYPYQEQQRYSGALVISSHQVPGTQFSDETKKTIGKIVNLLEGPTTKSD